MHFENGLTAEDVGPIHHDGAVKAAGAEQGRVEHFRPVRRGHDDDAAVGSEAVHFHQQLVKRLLTFVMAADAAGTASLAERIQLIDEYDARRLVLRLAEEIANAGSADPNEHLDEVGAAHAEKR